MSMLKAGATNVPIIRLTGAKAKAPAAYEYNQKHGRQSQNRPLPQKYLLIMSACMLFSHTRCGVSFTSPAGLSAAGRF